MRTHYKWVLGNGGVYSWVDITKGMSDDERTTYWEKRDAAREKREQARRNRGGWRLAAYHWEHESYREFQSVKITRHEASVFLRKFSRHFKTTCPAFSYQVRRGGGGHYTPSKWGTPSITVGAAPTLGIICHEYAHHLDTVRNPDTKLWHGKTFKRELKKVYTFAKRYLPVVHTPALVE